MGLIATEAQVSGSSCFNAAGSVIADRLRLSVDKELQVGGYIIASSADEAIGDMMPVSITEIGATYDVAVRAIDF